jgi:hypothetical protein
MPVGNGHDQGGAFRHDAVRKSPQQEPSRIVAVSRPGERKSSDLGYRSVDLISERGRCGRTSFGIPAGGGFSFFDRLVEKLKRGRHGRLRRGSGGELPTRDGLRDARVDSLEPATDLRGPGGLQVLVDFEIETLDQCPSECGALSAGRCRASSSSRFGSLTNEG